MAAVGEKLLPFAVSLRIALAVGIARQRGTPEGESPMGVRAFAVSDIEGVSPGHWIPVL